MESLSTTSVHNKQWMLNLKPHDLESLLRDLYLCYTNITFLSASLYMAVVFLVSIIVQTTKGSLMAVLSKASQWHQMLSHDPEVIGSSPSQVELGVCSPFCLS